MTDTAAPTLTSLNIPTSINLKSGTAALTVSGTATDNASGVKQVVIWFDKDFAYSFTLQNPSFSNYSLLGNFGITDSWSDGSSTQTWGVASTNPGGIYYVDHVDVQDQQGNTRVYSASELSAMGVNTAINFIGAAPDTAAPTLTSLNIPTSINLKSGTAALTVSGTATDNASGVKQVVIWFDKDFAYSFTLQNPSFSNYSLLGNFGITDSWSDGSSTQTWGVASTNPGGIYYVDHVDVQDQQGNTRVYSASELSAMGVNTAINFIGAAPEVPGTIGQVTLGSGAADILNGSSGNDHISGLGGEDRLNGKGGNDWLDGGDGTDTAVIEAPLSAVQTYSWINGVLTVTTAASTVTLINIERVQLADSLFAFDTEAPTDVAPGGHVWQAAALFHAGFGILPTQAALSEWAAKADNSLNMGDLGQKMIDYYAPGISATDLVTHLYLMLVKVLPTAVEVQRFVDQIGQDREFHTQGDLFSYAANLSLNTDSIVEFTGSIQQLDLAWF